MLDLPAHRAHKKRCRRPEPTCSQCAEDGHVSSLCTITPPLCVNCGGEHKSMSNKCPHYLYKSEVLATMTVHKIPFNEAADIVQDRFHEKGKPYSFAVRRNPQPTRNNRIQEEQPRRPSLEEILSPPPQNINPIKEQTQNQQAQILAHPIAQQEDPDIDLQNDHSTGTERENTSQQSQKITGTVNQTKVPQPLHLKTIHRQRF